MKLLLIEDNPAMQATLQRSFERRACYERAMQLVDLTLQVQARQWWWST